MTGKKQGAKAPKAEKPSSVELFYVDSCGLIWNDPDGGNDPATRRELYDWLAEKIDGEFVSGSDSLRGLIVDELVENDDVWRAFIAAEKKRRSDRRSVRLTRLSEPEEGDWPDEGPRWRCSWLGADGRTAFELDVPQPDPEAVEDSIAAIVERAHGPLKKAIDGCIEAWLGEPPDPETDTGLLEYENSASAFSDLQSKLSRDDLEALGITLTEGDDPWHDVSCAEMKIDVDEANAAAAERGLKVRFASIG